MGYSKLTFFRQISSEERQKAVDIERGEFNDPLLNPDVLEQQKKEEEEQRKRDLEAEKSRIQQVNHFFNHLTYQ